MMPYPTFPSNEFVSVTPSDTAILTYNSKNTKTRAIFVGGAGNLAIKNSLGTAVTFTGVAAGSVLPIATSNIMATNTTATNIAALF
jgi:hypothetical protein